MTAITNPIFWIFENLERYMFGNKILMGLAILTVIMFGMFFMKVNIIVMIILIIPLIMALTIGGYIPVAVMIFVLLAIAIFWYIFFKMGFFD